MDWFWSTGPFWFALFLSSRMFFNARAAFKLLLDWKGMLTTCRFVEDAYAALDALPDRGRARARAAARRCSCTWCPPTTSRTSPRR